MEDAADMSLTTGTVVDANSMFPSSVLAGNTSDDAAVTSFPSAVDDSCSDDRRSSTSGNKARGGRFSSFSLVDENGRTRPSRGPPCKSDTST